MKVCLNLGGVHLCLDAERPLLPSPELEPFFYRGAAAADVTVRVRWDWLEAHRPVTSPVGADLIQIFYREADCCFCELAGGDRGALARCCYDADFADISCSVNDVTCPVDQATVGNVLRMLPMRAIFQHFGVLFLHAAQIAYRGRGILFSAPSGTGKTTQARLWQAHRGAEIVCNDRTLLRKTGGVWRTYGYPLDGSEPVRSGSVHTLGCVVLLEQGTENTVQRLRPARAASLLMQQTVIDGWDAHAREQAMEQLMALLAEIPVYLLACTPDARAVRALETKLMEEGVLPDGNDHRPPLE